jgi:hypothetical protein
MRRAALCLSMLAMLGHAAAKPHPASSSPPVPKGPPHAWLFGTWTGGLFPVLDGMIGEDCRTQPTVGFGKDIVTHANLLGGAMSEQAIETVRTTPAGAEFHFTPGGNATSSFGCGDPNVLHVVREGDHTISFPHCTAYPYPLERCPAQ